MASAAYNATNNNWVVTQSSVSANSDHILFNATRNSMHVVISHSVSSVSNIDVDLDPGGAFAYKVATAGNITATGTPHHTPVNATLPFEFEDHNEGVPAADAELCFSPF